MILPQPGQALPGAPGRGWGRWEDQGGPRQAWVGGVLKECDGRQEPGANLGNLDQPCEQRAWGTSGRGENEMRAWWAGTEKGPDSWQRLLNVTLWAVGSPRTGLHFSGVPLGAQGGRMGGGDGS